MLVKEDKKVNWLITSWVYSLQYWKESFKYMRSVLLLVAWSDDNYKIFLYSWQYISGWALRKSKIGITF